MPAIATLIVQGTFQLHEKPCRQWVVGEELAEDDSIPACHPPRTLDVSVYRRPITSLPRASCRSENLCSDLIDGFPWGSENKVEQCWRVVSGVVRDGLKGGPKGINVRTLGSKPPDDRGRLCERA